MTLDDVSRAIHDFWTEVSSAFTPRGRNPLHREADWLRDRLQDAYGNLMRQRRGIEKLSARVGRDEKRVSDLMNRVETHFHVGDQQAAYRRALELEDVRRNLDVDRARLRREQREYQDQVAALNRLEKRRQQVAALLARPASAVG